MTESEAYFSSQSGSLYSVEKREPSDFQLVQYSMQDASWNHSSPSNLPSNESFSLWLW